MSMRDLQQPITTDKLPVFAKAYPGRFVLQPQP